MRRLMTCTFSALIVTFSTNSQASTGNNFGICKVRYNEGDSSFSRSQLVSSFRFKNDRLRVKVLRFPKAAYRGSLSFDPQNLELSISVNGKVAHLDVKELISQGKAWMRLDINAQEWITTSCESMDLESAFYELMRAYDEKD